MSDAALRRTLRRCTALLVLPLSLRVLQFRQFNAENGVGWRLLPAPVTAWLPALLAVGAGAYLLASAVGTLAAEGRDPADRPDA